MIDDIEFTMEGLPGTDVDASTEIRNEEIGQDLAAVTSTNDAVLGPVGDEPPVTSGTRPRTKRRVVTKVEQKHLAQEMLMHGIGNVLGYWHEDLGNQKKLAELGIDQEKFGEILLAQADRVAKALGFEQAWSN